MKLEALGLENFRRFKKLDISFHPELTVIAARNGQGKTAVLDAATIVLSPFVGAFDLGTSKGIGHKDARYDHLKDSPVSEQVFPVRLEAMLSTLNEPVVRERKGIKGRTTVKDATKLTILGAQLMRKIRNLESAPLPLMACYGSGRLWNVHKNMSREAVLSESRTMGYEDCFTSASSFRQVQQWMTKATFAELQQRQIDAYQGYNISDQIQGIRSAVDTVLGQEGWDGFHYSVQHEELAMTHRELGVLPVTMLSDGVRAMVSLAADMAWRCAKLNPWLGAQAQQETEGIVFIDEVDMHLHPKWQQSVVDSLRSAFPKVQLVMTTHSPQVLSTVESESIRLLRGERDEETGETSFNAQIPAMQSRGTASSEILAELQGVDPTPGVEEANWLAEYKELITSERRSRDMQARIEELKNRILIHFGESHHEWLECQRLSSFHELKTRIREKRQGNVSRD